MTTLHVAVVLSSFPTVVWNAPFMTGQAQAGQAVTVGIMGLSGALAAEWGQTHNKDLQDASLLVTPEEEKALRAKFIDDDKFAEETQERVDAVIQNNILQEPELKKDVVSLIEDALDPQRQAQPPTTRGQPQTPKEIRRSTVQMETKVAVPMKQGQSPVVETKQLPAVVSTETKESPMKIPLPRSNAMNMA